MNDLLEKLDKLALFFLIYTIVFIVFFKTLNYTLPFVLAFLFAFILKKPTQKLITRFKLKNSTASLITTLIFFAIILSLLIWGITSLTQEFIQLGKNTQVYLSKNSSNISASLTSTLADFQKRFNDLDPNLLDAVNKNLSSLISKASNLTVSFTGKVVSGFLIVIAYIPYMIMVILFTLLGTYFFTKDLSSAKGLVNKIIPQSKSDKLFYIISQGKKMLGNYLISYMIIIAITFMETIVVFLFFKVKYAVILSLICALFDILPILGIGAIYIPLSIIYFFIVKNYVTAFGILISYVLVSIIRQLIEPKIVSSSLGIHPVAVLAALFIGLKANGISGMIYCTFLVVFYKILKSVNVL